MTIVKWTVSPFNTPPARQEYSHETAKFYMHARGRGRDPKNSSWSRYFDTEAEAWDFIRQRNENKVEQKRVDHIKRHAVELLEALISLREAAYNACADSSCNDALYAADAAIAKAKSPAGNG
jgi:hypothetical protein